MAGLVPDPAFFRRAKTDAGTWPGMHERGLEAPHESSRRRRRPGRPLFRDPDEEGVAADAHHRVRAQPARRHLRLRRRVLRPDARHLRGLRPRELSRHHRPLRLLGRHRDPFPRHDPPHRRQRFLRLLACDAAEDSGPARALARRRRSSTRPEISPTDPTIRDADLVVAADGINSRLREAFADKFKPSVDLRPNFFSWMGSTRPFDAFTFFFRETDARHLHRPLLPVRAAALDLDHRDRSADLRARRPRQARRSGVGALRRTPVRRRAQGPPARSPTARSGAISRPSAASAGSPTTWC